MSELNNIKYEYVPNNKYKPEFEEDNPKKYGLDVLVDGFLFWRHRQNNGSLYYRCKFYNIYDCSASITIRDDGTVSHFVQHNNHVKVSQVDLDIKQFKHQCKIRTQTEDIPTNQVLP